jgi:hypothetical protein
MRLAPTGLIQPPPAQAIWLGFGCVEHFLPESATELLGVRRPDARADS